METVVIGADHRGFKLKEFLKEELRENDFNIVDMGNVKYEKDDDYVEIGLEVAERVALKKIRGILICGSGIGMSIIANKVKGIRAALVMNEKQARVAREHDDANILCLSADFINEEDNLEISKIFLNSLFSSEERYLKRVKLIKDYERTEIS